MKKLLLLLSFSTILSCSSSDGKSGSNNKSITPPAWIQGTWLQVMSNDPYIAQPVFRFKTNDFCAISSSLETCQANSLQQAAQAGASTNIDQVITDNEYKLSVTILSQTTTFHFIKINNSKIEIVNPTIGLPNTPLIKQ